MSESAVPARRSVAARLIPGFAASSPWRITLPALLLLWAALLLLYRDTAIGMVQIWLRSDTFAHAIVVPPIVLWLVVRQRHALAAIAPAPEPRMLWAMGAAAFLWLLGQLSATNAVSQFAWVAMLALCVPALAGMPLTRCLAFPLGFMFFAVPIGEFMLPAMIGWTADFTVAALRLSGIPVYREGQQFIIPSGNWSVVEACSGVRYLIASLMTGVLYAYLNYRSTRRRLVFVGISIAVPVVANWLRAYMIVLLGHLSDNRIAAGADHLVYGWIFFGVVMLLMFAIGGRWAEARAPSPATAPHAAPAGPGFASVSWITTIAATLIAITPHALQHGLAAGERTSAPTLGELALPPWSDHAAPADGWTPAFKEPAAQLRRTYVAPDGRSVDLYVGYYRRQDGNRKLVGSGSALVRSDDGRWRTKAVGTSAVVVGDRTIPVRTTRLGGDLMSNESRLAVWQVYWVNGTWVASETWARLHGAWHRLLGRGDDAAVVLVHAIEERPGEADALLGEFLRAHAPALERYLERTRDGG